MQSLVRSPLALLSLLLLPFAASAQSAIDVSDVVSQLGTMPATILAIGAGLLIAAAVAVTVKWAKATIFS